MMINERNTFFKIVIRRVYKNVQRWCELEKKIDLRLRLYGI